MKIAIRRLKDGKPKYVVAQHYNVYRGTISCLWQRYLQTGCPRSATARQDRYNRIFHLRNTTVTAQQTTSSIPGFRRIFEQTVPNSLWKAGLQARRLYSGPILVIQHRCARVELCNTVRNWTLRNWRRIWFSDESRWYFSALMAVYLFIGETRNVLQTIVCYKLTESVGAVIWFEAL